MTKTLLCGVLLVSLIANPTQTPVLEEGGAKTALAAWERAKVEASAINQALLNLPSASQVRAQWAALDAKIVKHQERFGVNPNTIQQVFALRRTQVTVGAALQDRIPYTAFLQILAADPDPKIAALAEKPLEKQKQLEEQFSKPLELKFTAIEGTEIDVSKLKGKVVLLNFWASWYRPCAKEMSQVVEAYKKYHAQGLEVCGISLDYDKTQMLAFVKAQGMEWPQYWDGKRWECPITKTLHIQSLPVLLLLDQHGIVVARNAREDLILQVEKLLKAPSN